jgi:hypothetical protein
MQCEEYISFASQIFLIVILLKLKETLNYKFQQVFLFYLK